MLNIIFRARQLNEEQRKQKEALQVLDVVRSGGVDLNVTMCTDAQRMSEKFEESLAGTPFKVIEINVADDDQSVELKIFPKNAPQHSDYLLFSELEMRLAEFERQHDLPSVTQVCCL